MMNSVEPLAGHLEPGNHRNLNAERGFGEFDLVEHLIIEEYSGVPFRGTFWGGFGDPVRMKRYTPLPRILIAHAICHL
jgi:hypothetical protein